MCPSSELLNNDGNYHYMQAISNLPNSSSGYMAQVSAVQKTMEFIDYTNTMSQGKAVLYGIK